MNYTLFIFRRDLRIKDNLGLLYANKNCENIIPIFIFTPEQVINNDFKSNNAIQFMIESLKDLEKQIGKLKSKFQGDNIKIINRISKKINISNIVFNKDYTPYAIKRDKLISEYCEKNNIKCNIIEDYLLSNIGDLNKDDGFQIQGANEHIHLSRQYIS